MAGAEQFFYFILKRLPFISSAAIVSVILVILAHIGVGGVHGFSWWWDEGGLECFTEKS